MEGQITRERITELRISKGVSEYQMSLDLGQNRTYIQGISSGKALPSMDSFLKICDYFGITPSEFFEIDTKNPQLLHQIVDDLKNLSSDDLSHIQYIVKRMKQKL